MKTIFKTLFWLLVVYTAITIELASIKQVVIECILLIVLTFPVFFYDDIKKYLNDESGIKNKGGIFYINGKRLGRDILSEAEKTSINEFIKEKKLNK